MSSPERKYGLHPWSDPANEQHTTGEAIVIKDGEVKVRIDVGHGKPRLVEKDPKTTQPTPNTLKRRTQESDK